MPLTILPKAHVDHVCKPGSPACCAYLASKRLMEDFYCAKGDPALLPIIESRLKEGSLGAKGDNCGGPPDYALKS